MKNDKLRILRLRPVIRYIQILDMTSYEQGNPEISELRWCCCQLVIDSVGFHLWKILKRS